MWRAEARIDAELEVATAHDRHAECAEIRGANVLAAYALDGFAADGKLVHRVEGEGAENLLALAKDDELRVRPHRFVGAGALAARRRDHRHFHELVRMRIWQWAQQHHVDRAE